MDGSGCKLDSAFTIMTIERLPRYMVAWMKENGHLPDLSDMDSDIQDLIRACCRVDPIERTSSSEIYTCIRDKRDKRREGNEASMRMRLPAARLPLSESGSLF